MAVSLDLLLNAVVSGLLLGGFYAAVTVGVSISFGMLDIVNIAHPAFIMLGSYVAFIVNTRFGIDPILASVIVAAGLLRCSASAIYQVYHVAFERRGDESLRGLAFFFGLLFITEVGAGPGLRRRLPLRRGALYRHQPASRRRSTCRCACWCRSLVSLAMMVGLQLFLSRTFIGRAIHGGGAGPAGAAADGGRPGADQAHRLRPLDRHRRARRRHPHHHPAGRAVDRPRLYRPRLRHLRAGRPGQLPRHADRGDDCSASSRA